MQLRPYQLNTLESIIDLEKKGINKTLAVLATGLGKTVCFASLPQLRENSFPMLVLAHRDELLDQAADKIKQCNSNISISKEKAKDQGSLDTNVVVASVQSLGRGENNKRLLRYPKDHFRYVVVDEAHHAAAKSYRNILDYFSYDLLLGVTATPQRTDNVALTDIFDEVCAYYPIDFGIKEGYLCSIKGIRIKTSADISNVKTTAGDFSAKELAEAIDLDDRNNLIISAYEQHLLNRPTIIFAASVAHGYRIKDAARTKGISAECIDAKTSSEDRAEIYQKFRNKSISLLINVGVLTEGFDEPSVSGIILARPTKSSLLYTQMIGRGTRLFNGKDDCIIVDLADVTNNKSPIGLPSLMGMPADFDLEGEDLLEAHEKWSELATKSPEIAENTSSLSEIEAGWEQVSLLDPAKLTDGLVLEHSTLVWHSLGDNSYSISPANQVRISIIQSILGYKWEVLKNNENISESFCSDIKDAFHQADSYIKENYKDSLNLISLESKWRDDPPTTKQIKFLRRKGIPITTDLTKGAASQIIQQWIDANPRSPIQEAIIARNKAKRESNW